MNKRWLAGGMVILAILLVGNWWKTREDTTRLATGQAWRVGYNQTEPFLFRNTEGQAAGFAHDVLTAAAAQKGIRLQWVFVPGGAYQAFQDGQIDLFPRTVNVPGIARPTHITQPWFESYYGLVEGGRADSSGARAVATGPAPFLQDFGAKRLPGARLESSPSWRQAIARLCRGEVNGVFAELREATVELLDGPDDCRGLPLKLRALPGAVLPAGIGATQAAAPVADLLRDAIGVLSDNGTLATLHSRWYLELPYGVTAAEAAARSGRERRNLWIGIAGALALCVAAWVVALRLRSLQREAELAAEVKSMFLATISHELRTPMNGVLGMSQLLKHTRLDEEQRHMVDTISHSGESLLRLINEVLDLSRLESGQVSIAADPFVLREMIRKTVDVLAPAAAGKSLELKVHVHPDLPAAFRGDELRLRQVLLNLVGNAIKFTERGHVLVDVRPGQRAGEVWFMVSDTGIGIRSEVLPTLFDPFVQADATTTRIYGGTGLGLAISKKLVEAMGGRIGMESEVGAGTRCWFHVPLLPMPAEPETPSVRPRPLKILLAEDNLVNQTVARRLLERQGHEVHVVSNGRMALDAIAGGPWDLILMDCQMPEMDGYAATRQIRQMESALARRTPIIALTAHAMADDRAKCLDAGMDDYLPKPLRVDDLDAVLGRLATA